MAGQSIHIFYLPVMNLLKISAHFASNELRKTMIIYTSQNCVFINGNLIIKPMTVIKITRKCGFLIIVLNTSNKKTFFFFFLFSSSMVVRNSPH